MAAIKYKGPEATSSVKGWLAVAFPESRTLTVNE